MSARKLSGVVHREYAEAWRTRAEKAEADLTALRAERDGAAKTERERIARKFDDKAATCRAMLKVETNIGRLAEYARAVAEWEFCAAMAREEASS